jgi:hypothetical protein
MAALKQYAFDAAVQEAYLKTLREDPAVQLRLNALENLSKRGVDPDLIFNAIRTSDRDSNPAVIQFAEEITGGL